MSDNTKTVAYTLGFCLVVLLCALGVMVHFRNDADEKCAAKGATAVSTGRSNYLCVTPDGRIVGNP